MNQNIKNKAHLCAALSTLLKEDLKRDLKPEHNTGFKTIKGAKSIITWIKDSKQDLSFRFVGNVRMDGLGFLKRREIDLQTINFASRFLTTFKEQLNLYSRTTRRLLGQQKLSNTRVFRIRNKFRSQRAYIKYTGKRVQWESVF